MASEQQQKTLTSFLLSEKCWRIQTELTKMTQNSKKGTHLSSTKVNQSWLIWCTSLS